MFPSDFVFGAATSAYQIEGSPLADDAGPSIWHQFVRTPGRISNDDTGDVACDHYRRYPEDIRLMKTLGLQAYRFSVSWSRILPDGRGRINQKGLWFYQRLVDGLLEAGIEPYLTLYHWDLPAALDQKGGWVNRDIAGWFADYAQILFRALNGKVSHWMTLNEPWVVNDGGYLFGVHAPGRASLTEPPWVTHNLLRAHAMAVQAFRAEGTGKIGLVVNLEPKYAASENEADRQAVERVHAYMNRQYLDPVLLGTYPDELVEIFGEAWPRFPDADMKLLREPFDFLGVNYYTRSVNRADASSRPFGVAQVAQSGAEYTEMGWEVFPEGLSSTLLWVKRRYGDIPLYVTENGAAFDDPAPSNGSIQDDRRIAYFRSHLTAVLDALAQGAAVKGYFAWSLLDNFEWSCGFSKRFGLVHVDPHTQNRTPKASAGFYRNVIESRGKVLVE